MTKCIILRGLPGIGKSTRASKQGLVIISKDTIRLGKPKLKEEDVRIVQNDLLKLNYEAGLDCILDNTHMFPGSLERAINECKAIGFEIEVKDFMIGQPLVRHKEASSRNFNRPTRVPQSVIDKMFLSAYKLEDISFKRQVYIFDLDGTLANLDHRLHYIKDGKKDWGSFFREVGKDSVIENVSKIWHSLSSPTICKIIVSGRSNQCAFATEEWLQKNGFNYDFILMRDGKDHRDDVEVKRELYNKCLKKNNIMGVFDDRRRVIDMRQEEGVFTFDVSQGKVF